MIARFVTAARSASGFKRFLILAICGIATAGSLPPYYALPLGIVGFSMFILVAIAGSTTAIRACKDGISYGFGFFTAGVYWIAVALHVDLEQLFWLVPFAACGIPLVLSIYSGIAGYVSIKLSGSSVCMRITLFLCGWMIFVEAIRAYAFSGFPWNLLGYSWASTHTIMQAASIGGIWLLSIIACVCFAVPAYIYVAVYREGSKIFCMFAVCVGVLAPITAHIYGSYRIQAYVPEHHDGFKVRIVQPNIAQIERFSPKNRRQQLERLLELSTTDDTDVRYIVWPEAAIPYLITEEIGAPDVVERIVPEGGALLTGIVRGRMSTADRRPTHMYNSFASISRDGLGIVYDKAHLVPFGEYVPLRSLFPFVEKLTHGSLDFTAGSAPQTYRINEEFPPFSPLICYEIIFPGDVIADAPAERPEVIVNVTNDGWYGDTGGPHQHFAMAVIRAVEEGIPVIRASNSGISGYIDPLGRVQATLSYNTHGILDFRLPKALKHPPLFSQIRR